jgi:menaquinone-specific isochorismate synthase
MSPTRYTVRAVQSRAWWDDAVAGALAAIAEHGIEKVVLAREVTVDADADFDVRTVLRRLRSQQPGCIVYGDGGFVGATPELLVRRHGRAIESRPMAGTAPGSVAEEVARTLAASNKDAREHRFVVEGVRDVLAPLTTALEVPEHPEVEHFGNLAHLVTPIRGSLVDPSVDALSLARLLHPSPAVGGTPTHAALQVIDELEPFDRGAYAGPVGWVDARGDGAFAVALRGAQLAGAHALLRAGAGIVAGSNPDAEWAETAVKFEPMLRALVVP